uniref:FAD synthase n=1 Tax=Macrostomum lignano TaxID=282301 RepID=A0A1I8HKV0_9PLAT
MHCMSNCFLINIASSIRPGRKLLLNCSAQSLRCFKISAAAKTKTTGMQQTPSFASNRRFALLVIGDEILKGQVADTNTYYLCRQLTSLGHRVCEVSVIADSKQVIADRVRYLSANYDYVITTGGIGPTHDDVTFEAIAGAFNETTHHHPELVSIVRQYFDKTADPNEPIESYIHKPYMRLCRVPLSAVLNYGFDASTSKRSEYPVVSVSNVFVFPGVPSLCKKAYRLMESQFKGRNQQQQSSNSVNSTDKASSRSNDSPSPVPIDTADNIYINRDEINLTPIIDNLVAKFPSVTIGSYPEWHNRYYKTRIYLEAGTVDELTACRKFLTDQFDAKELVRYDPDPVKRANIKVEQFIVDTQSDNLNQFQLAFDVAKRAISNYGLDAIAVGFNGGKDCTALLHLVYAAAAATTTIGSSKGQQQQKLRLLYLRSRQQFPEAELFIDETVERYSPNVQLLAYEGDMKTCLHEMKRDWPSIRAVFMGTRSTDPRSGHLNYEQMTDVEAGWPEFLRISPLLQWSYSDVWRFLRTLCLPYCPLYDRGYTSLGDMSNTHPNPKLQYKDSRGLLKYMPAYCLESGSDERKGRNQQPQQTESSSGPDAKNGGARPAL